MKIARRLIIGSLLSASALVAGLSGCAVHDDAAPGSDQLVADTLAQTCKSVSFMTPAIQADEAMDALLGREQSVRSKNREACADYNAGVALTSLAGLPMAWDVQCLGAEGWTLGPDNQPLPQQHEPGQRYYAADVAHCGTQEVTPAVCASIRQAFAPDQSALDVESASLIRKFGCDNIAVEGFMGG